MEQNTTTTAETPNPQVSAPQLVRPVEGRVVAGVAQGVASRFGIPLWLVRTGFVLTAFFGGLGVALYLAGWALLRSEDETESPAERFFSGASTSKAWIGIGLIFLAALILLDNLTFLSGGVIWAVALLVVGVLLYTGQIPIQGRPTTDPQSSDRRSGDPLSKEGVQQMTQTETAVITQTDSPSGDSPSGGGKPPTPALTPPILPPSASKPKESSILGRLTVGFMLLAVGILAVLDNIPDVPVYPEPRHYLALAVTVLGIGLIVGAFAGRARWLIIVGVVLVPTLMFSPLFEIEWTSESFELVSNPTTFEEIQDEYSIEIGNLELDLTDLPWDGEEITIETSVDLGNIELRIPSEVAIVGEASVDIGHVGTPGRESAGLGDPTLVFDETDRGLGTVFLNAHVDMGNIDIRR
jgi:phage shock protein PspC (stress-responsive transcriptional regulator)